MSCTVTFLPEGRHWRGEAPVPLSFALAACDVVLEQPCGGRTGCGRCRVRLRDAPPPAAIDREVLGEADALAGWRLGCRLMIERTATIEVPWSSRVVAHKSFGGPALFADGFEPACDEGWGIALDVGTTTLAAGLVALDTGQLAATAAVLNPQVTFGADVMSRIAFARRHAQGGSELQRALVAGVQEVVGKAAANGGVDVAAIRLLAAVGNPTMMHALAGLPLAPLGVAPYQGVRYDAWEGEAGGLGLALPGTRALLLPGIGAHIGADTVAALLATGLDRGESPRLLLDLGTNTEVALASARGITCTSAAAGPAFEGASIRCGTRAVPGAIDQVQIEEDGTLRCTTLHELPPVGICGSGLVDAVAELVRAGAVERSGRLRPAAELGSLPRLAQRILEAGGERQVLLGGDARPVVLTAGDIRELQLVKASIAAAVRLLLEDAALAPADLEQVLIAGTFGSYVRLGSALALGLLPPVAPERVRFVGNAAGAGARLALVDARARERATRLARTARFVELAGRPDYQEAFVALLPFPEPV